MGENGAGQRRDCRGAQVSCSGPGILVSRRQRVPGRYRQVEWPVPPGQASRWFPERIRMSELTQMRAGLDASGLAATAKLLPLVYDELRRMAAEKIAREKPGRTLATAPDSTVIVGQVQA